LLGPSKQIREARTALQLDAAETASEGDEWLYALTLSELVVPTALSTGAILCRAPLPNERDTLCNWRLAYDIEILGAVDSTEQRARATLLAARSRGATRGVLFTNSPSAVRTYEALDFQRTDDYGLVLFR
jgi:hypothetical protein